MTDADRLRGAADLCDKWAADTKAANSALLTSWKIDAATAALLRVVADTFDEDRRLEAEGWEIGPPDPTQRAALALADVILGSDR